MPDRPTVCRSCGAIVGAGEPGCGVCGVPIAAQPTIQQRQRIPDRETLRFARAVLDRPHKFTITFLIANLFVYLLMWHSSGLGNVGLWQEFPPGVLIAYGAKLNSLIAPPNREWWRFVTPVFIHVNLLHLLVNMYSLWMIGPYVEKLYGSAKFVVFWVLTGIAGVVASYLTVRPSLATGLGRFVFKTMDELSAGASGALFGLVGVLFVFGIKFRHELPEGFKRAFGTGLLPIILINLFIGFLGRRFIDNAAHLGGLLSGAALAAVVQYRRPGESQTSAITWRVLQIAALAIVAVSFLKVAQNFNAPPPDQVITQVEIFNAYASVMNQAQESVNAMLYEGNTTNVDAAMRAVQSVPALDAKAGELRKRLLDLMARAKTQAASRSSQQQGPRRGPKLDEKLIAEYVTWRKEYDVWLKTAAPSLNP